MCVYMCGTCMWCVCVCVCVCSTCRRTINYFGSLVSALNDPCNVERLNIGSQFHHFLIYLYIVVNMFFFKSCYLLFFSSILHVLKVMYKHKYYDGYDIPRNRKKQG